MTGEQVAAGVSSGLVWDTGVLEVTRFQPMKSYVCRIHSETPGSSGGGGGEDRDFWGLPDPLVHPKMPSVLCGRRVGPLGMRCSFWEPSPSLTFLPWVHHWSITLGTSPAEKGPQSSVALLG